MIWPREAALSLGPGPISPKTLVAITTSLRAVPRFLKAWPERLLGQAFKNLGTARKDVVIATKVFGEMGPGPNDKAASRGHIMDSVHDSLERLQVDHIDLYQIHGNDTVTPIDETLRALD